LRVPEVAGFLTPLQAEQQKREFMCRAVLLHKIFVSLLILLLFFLDLFKKAYCAPSIQIGSE